jgi:hypothetical protein
VKPKLLKKTQRIENDTSGSEHEPSDLDEASLETPAPPTGNIFDKTSSDKSVNGKSLHSVFLLVHSGFFAEYG